MDDRLTENELSSLTAKLRELKTELETALKQGDVTAPAGKRALAYWRSRLEFAVQALVEKERVHEGGVRIYRARSAADDAERQRLTAEAENCYERAVTAGEAGLRAMASQVRDESDRNSLAAYYHFCVREVREKAAELLAGAEGVHVQTEPM